MPSVEMLKKLLDEFVEKEIFIKEELSAVTDQIAELESRLDLCRQRLSTISGDRNKVLVMQGRYLNGDIPGVNVAPTAPVSAPVPVMPVAATPPPPAPTLAPTPTPVPDQAPAALSPASTRATGRQGRSGISAILGNRSINAERPGPAAPASIDAEPAQVPTEALPVEPELQSAANNRFDSQSPGVVEPQTWEQQTQTQDPLPTAQAPSNGAPSLLNDEDPDMRELGQSIVDLGASDETNDESESDTIKNINDALRSLFR